MCCFGQTLVGATISSIVEHSALHLFFFDLGKGEQLSVLLRLPKLSHFLFNAEEKEAEVFYTESPDFLSLMRTPMWTRSVYKECF